MAISAANLRRQSYEFQQSTAAGRWRWSTVVDVSGAVPSFSVSGIDSPYGILRDSVPIPGEIIQAMGESIAEVRAQFPPSILLAPTSLVFTLTEGEGFSAAQEVAITNNGVFGSLLGASLTSSSGAVTVAPAQVGSLAANESGTFDVAADSAALLAIDSPYSASITVQDSSATNTPRVLPVTITVLPKATISAAPGTLSFSAVKPLSGAFPLIPSQTFVLENTGPFGSVLNWQIQRVCCTPWLASFGPVSGTLNAGATQTMTVVAAPPLETQPGTYTETLRVTGFSSNQSVDVTLQLSIT